MVEDVNFGRYMSQTVGFTKSLQNIITESFQANFDRLAVIDPKIQLSYSDLAGHSSKSAEQIAEVTYGAPARIALMFSQDASYIVALIATLRAGCTYVPLDPRRGLGWNRDVVTQTDCTVLLCSEMYAEFASRLGVPTKVIRLPKSVPLDNGICISRSSDDLACIYSTSGTTGSPKAVCDLHRNIIHNAWRYSQSLRTTPEDRLSLIQAPIFSGTQSTIFMGLITGSTLCSFDATSLNLGGLSSWLRDSRVTMFHSVPAIFRTLAIAGVVYDDIRLVRIEGDRATDEDVQVLRSHFREDCIMVNGLGATECGIIRQYFINPNTIVADGDLPVGCSVPDMDVTIIDESGALCSPGQSGEILVTSKYLAQGYLGDEQNTRAKFDDANNGLRSYKTGDIGYIDKEGLLWMRGRDNRQVKIKGETVDLNAIELALKRLPVISSVLVDAHTDDHDITSIAAYLVPKDGLKPTLETMRLAIAETLDSHLRPTHLIWLDCLPLSIDGKLDRKSLPRPNGMRPDMETRYVAPRSEIERALADIWQSILGIEPVGIFDDVMILGCDSLSIVHFANRVKTFFGVSINIASVFRRPTIAAIAGTIEKELENSSEAK
jgi:acyl-coenzyme A synthetase/AMP-(fatty) acid ligase